MAAADVAIVAVPILVAAEVIAAAVSGTTTSSSPWGTFPFITIPGLSGTHCPKSNTNFRDIMQKVQENEMLQEIFCVVSRFPHYVSYYISENRLPLGQCTVRKAN